MLGATLEVLDGSIINVSLPHMQGSFSASVDEIAWVLMALAKNKKRNGLWRMIE
jgi:hypothetical protein